MRRVIYALVILGVLMSMCARQEAENPFLEDFKTPFGTPPFGKIEESHFMPAFLKGMQLHQDEIAAIVDNEDDPTFENTLEALEKSGEVLTTVSNVFNNLKSANTNDDIQEIAKEVAPLLAKHNDDILLNEALYNKIKAVYEHKADLNLSVEQNTLLEKYYQDFVRGGANLEKAKKDELRKINEALSVLSVHFGDNILNENNEFEMVIEDEANLAGLPADVIQAASESAAERGHHGKWVFTLHKPSMIPFLQYSDIRPLREKIFKGYINRGNNNDENDNKEIVSRIVNLRIRKAHLLGYDTYADFVLEENMAKTPEKVYEFMRELWLPANNMAKKEAYELQTLIFKEGHTFKLEPWDWWYYTEKLKKLKYDLDDETLRPYFKLENVIQSAFMVANKLWGIEFEERDDIPTYHKDVKTFEVKEANGDHIGILYTDYFPRASKRGGAWMSEFRKQSNIGGDRVTPLITNVLNFSKPTGKKPSLLSLDEVQTLFHEFGHGLHGLLSDCTYPKLSGTDVARDFVELPSQIMENWATDPEVLKLYAKHYETGEPIPDDLLNKIVESSKFNQGFITAEYLSAAFLDMDWHTLTDTTNVDPMEFETTSMKKIDLIPEIVVRYRSPYFAHIFSGGYAAGYYVYIWAEVLDADAFKAFKDTDIFNKDLAAAYRKNILAAGSTEDPMVLYKRFRGAEPKIDPLLKKRGLK
jgi:peptidyl-dipeptidase Dcp